MTATHPGTAGRIDESIAFVPVHIALLTVSDTRSKDDDVSGDTLEKRLKDAGHIICARTIVCDDHKQHVRCCGSDTIESMGGAELYGACSDSCYLRRVAA